MGITDDPQLYSSGYERNRLDRYWTHPWMINELFKKVGDIIESPIWEPAAGRGDIVKAILELDRTNWVYASDIDMNEYPYNISANHEGDFLEEFMVPVFDDNTVCRSIITNPPYNEPRGVADRFIRHGLSFFDHDQDRIEFMAMLLRSEFRCGKSRADMFGECHHYMGELVLTTRPRWDYGNPNAPEDAAPRNNFSWFIWSHSWGEENDPVQLFSYMPKGFKP